MLSFVAKGGWAGGVYEMSAGALSVTIMTGASPGTDGTQLVIVHSDVIDMKFYRFD